MTAEQSKRFAAELKKLPPLATTAEKLNWCERLSFLDAVAAFEQEHEGKSGSGKGRPERSLARKLTDSIFAAEIDFNDALRSGNRWYDRAVAAASQPTCLKRIQAAAEFDRDFRQMAHDAEPTKLGNSGIVNGESSRKLGDRIVGLLFPAFGAALEAEDSDRQRLDLVCLTFALAAYHADNQTYPANIADLAPQISGNDPTGHVHRTGIAIQIDHRRVFALQHGTERKGRRGARFRRRPAGRRHRGPRRSESLTARCKNHRISPMTGDDTINRQDAKDAKKSPSWRPWRLGGSQSLKSQPKIRGRFADGYARTDARACIIRMIPRS